MLALETAVLYAGRPRNTRSAATLKTLSHHATHLKTLVPGTGTRTTPHQTPPATTQLPHVNDKFYLWLSQRKAAT